MCIESGGYKYEAYNKSIKLGRAFYEWGKSSLLIRAPTRKLVQLKLKRSPSESELLLCVILKHAWFKSVIKWTSLGGEKETAHSL